MKVCPSDNHGSPRESILPGVGPFPSPRTTAYNMKPPAGQKGGTTMTNHPIIDKQSSVPYTQTQEGISADA